MATNECSVVNPAVYGPYKQTIFLGCSVLGFTATAGWNGQNSEVTVELAQDTCSPPVDRPKRYWANPTTIFPVAQLWYGADPGFTFPNVGAPVYFRVEDFEYSGLIQGWTIKESPSGSPVYTVKIVDPRPVLDHTQIILDSYEGSINGVYNLLNVYAYLEYTSGGTGNRNTDCEDNVVGGIGIGAPAKGFGGAQRTERGIPWDRIKDGIQDLAGSAAGTPDSRFSMGGVFYREGSGKGWGELNFNNGGNVGTAKYLVDISDVPDAYFTEYRIGGPITSLSEIVNQVCADSGCDYYVELLPTSGQLIIKIRTISRRNQPALNGISNFILGKNILYGGEGIVNDSYGRELRSEINTSFVIGAKARQYFEQEASSYMTPFWGYDAEGNLMESKLRSGTANNWQVLLDFRKINLALNNPVSLDITTNSKGSTGFGWVEEIELRLAQGDYDTFKNKILSPVYPDTVLKKYFETTVKLGASRVLQVNPADVRAVLNFPPGQESGKKSGDVTGSETRDGQAVYNWLRSYSTTFYGKQFLFQVPHVCKATDSTSGKEVFSDEPSTEGAWPSLIQGGSLVDNTDLLGITVPSTQADFFRDETGKVQAMVKLTGSNLDTSGLDVSDYLVHGNNVWIKATIEAEWIQGTPVQGVSDDNIYAALLQIPSAVFNKVAALSTKTNVELIEMIPGVPDALKAQAATAPQNTAGLSATTGAAAFEAVMPIAGGVPLKSNTRTYGPWYRTGANPGAVSCEIDEGLAPWEYGGIAFMNKAGQAKVYNAVTSMQYGERGEVTIPGYPRISLGSALSTNPPSFLYDGRQVGTGGHSWPRGGWSYNYVSWNSPSESTTGATISNINVTVGTQGVTTSYTISTFTPVFGRFAKGNAERLKQIGLNKLSGERELRARNALKRLLRASVGRLGQGADHGVAVNAESPKSAAVLFAGKLVEDNKRKVVLAGTQSSFPYYQDYDNTSMMSMDGFFRPVSNYGDASLPKIATNSGTCLTTQADGPPPPVKTYTGLPIVQKYLDFLADPVSNTTLMDDPRANSSTSGHDIESVGRKSVSWLKANQPDGSRSLLVHVSGSQTYADDYRYMAMRGPMVMQSWGYDLHGKPIPNEVGDSSSSFQSSYAGLKDTFKENWLSDARDWPVAPVDLRFDRKRGVWTVPSAFRLYQVKAKNDIESASEGDAEIIKYKTDIVDGGGSTISSPEVSVENWGSTTFSEGSTGLAYYDTAECKYWLIPGPSNSGTSGIGVACSDEEVTSCESPFTSTPIWDNIEFINFGENLFVKGSTAEGKKGIIVATTGGGGGGGSKLKIGSAGSCISPTLDCEEYECLKFADGLDLSIDGTNAIVKGPKIASDKCGSSVTATHFAQLTFEGLKVEKDEGGAGADCNYTVYGPKITAKDCNGSTAGGMPNNKPFNHLTFDGFEVKSSPSNGGAGECKFTISSPKIASQACNGDPPADTTFEAFNKLVIGKGIQYTKDNCKVTISGPTIESTDICELAGDTPIEATPFDSLKIDGGLKLARDSDSGENSCNFTLSGPEIGKYEDACDPGQPGASNPLGRLYVGGGLSLAQPPSSSTNYKACDWVITGHKVKGKSKICGGSDVGPKDFGTLTFGKGLQLSATSPTDSNDTCKEYTVKGWTLTAGAVTDVTKLVGVSNCGGGSGGTLGLGTIKIVDGGFDPRTSCNKAIIGTEGRTTKTFTVVTDVTLSCVGDEFSFTKTTETLKFCGGLLEETSVEEP